MTIIGKKEKRKKEYRVYSFQCGNKIKSNALGGI